MSLTEETANSYNLKRAQRFADAGINAADVTYAHPEFLGIGDTACSLCDHAHIVWLFRLRFDAPDLIDSLAGIAKGIHRTAEVVFDNVGSTCITQWFDALPESAEKLAALGRWHAEVQKMNALKKRKACESLCLKAGYDSPEAAFDAWGALDLYSYKSAARKALTGSQRAQLKRNAYGVKHATSSVPTVKAWLANLLVAVTAANLATDASITEEITTHAPSLIPPTPVDELAKLSATDRDAIVRGRAAWKSGKANLNAWEQDTFKDIGQKVVKYGSFAPGGKQRALYVKLLSLLEKVASPAPAPVAATTVAAPATYVSPSGIDGARY
ncbi:MAG TPA: hypothetical protein VFH61_04015, partial [Thermoleophilia bacterium]|nr:hypothetical protein [Thermoleophilia bacterium]